MRLLTKKPDDILKIGTFYEDTLKILNWVNLNFLQCFWMMIMHAINDSFKDQWCTLALSFNKFWINNELPTFSHFQDIDRSLDNDVKKYFKTWIERINEESIKSDQKLSRKYNKNKNWLNDDIEEWKGLNDNLLNKDNKKINIDSYFKMTKVSPIKNGFVI